MIGWLKRLFTPRPLDDIAPEARGMWRIDFTKNPPEATWILPDEAQLYLQNHDLAQLSRDLDQRLAVRRANRAKSSESARNGHSTRWQKAGAKCREMFHGNLEL